MYDLAGINAGRDLIQSYLKDSEVIKGGLVGGGRNETGGGVYEMLGGGKGKSRIFERWVGGV